MTTQLRLKLRNLVKENERQQEEGVAMYEAYNAKCEKLKTVSGQFEELQAVVVAQVSKPPAHSCACGWTECLTRVGVPRTRSLRASGKQLHSPQQLHHRQRHVLLGRALALAPWPSPLHTATPLVVHPLPSCVGLATSRWLASRSWRPRLPVSKPPMFARPGFVVCRHHSATRPASISPYVLTPCLRCWLLRQASLGSQRSGRTSTGSGNSAASSPSTMAIRYDLLREEMEGMASKCKAAESVRWSRW